MKYPPQFLTGFALLFWGWQTEMMIAGIALATIIEGARFTQVKYDFKQRDFRNVWNLCGAIFIGVFFFVYTSGGGYDFLTIIKWLPMIFGLLAVVVSYSESRIVDYRVFRLFYWERAGKKIIGLDFTYPYIATIIAATSAANVRDIWFYAGLCAVMTWALWRFRSKSYPVWLWILALAIVITAGFAGSVGLQMADSYVTERMVEYFAESLREDTDPFKTHTAMGQLGKLKLSEKILARVHRAGVKINLADPVLLIESSYNTYRRTAWYTARSAFKDLKPEKNGVTWRIGKGTPGPERIAITTELKKGSGLAFSVERAVTFESLAAKKVGVNRMGAVKLTSAPEFLNYSVALGKESTNIGSPDHFDLAIPKNLEPVVGAIAKELKLATLRPETVLAVVSRYFAEKYSYSLELSGRRGKIDPVADFLLRTKQGHCEFFATATVMLLRKAGLPARYTVGYLAHEYSWLEKSIVVRGRDAHAWVSVYIGGKWRSFDTTPPSWVSADAENSTLLEPLKDLFSYIGWLISTWRNSDSDTDYTLPIGVALVLLMIYMVSRSMGGTKLNRTKISSKEDQSGEIRSGAESGLYKLEKKLAKTGRGRHPWETYSAWIARIEDNETRPVIKCVQPLLDLHNRMRFDPTGITETEKKNLDEGVGAAITLAGRISDGGS